MDVILNRVFTQLFAENAPEFIDALEKRIKPVHLKKGDVLYRQGEPGTGMHIIVTGRLQVRVAAEIGGMNLTVRDVLSLATGDVIRLKSVRTGDQMVLKVGNKPKYMCRPGLVGNKLAVQITEKLEDISRDEFEELAAEGEE